MICEYSISGYRGFGKKQCMQFALPSGKKGSGLSVIVGANNSGKTSIIESLRYFNASLRNPSFSNGKRNLKTAQRVDLEMIYGSDKYRIVTDSRGGSSTLISKNGEEKLSDLRIYILPSRRSFEYEFNHREQDRDTYVQELQYMDTIRDPSLTGFHMRLFQMYERKGQFDTILKRVLGRDLEWTIEQNDRGKYFLKITNNGSSHSSEGMGDGIWSVFTICDALYDSQKGSVIAIDEPELSLHPALQKRLVSLLKEYSADRQIIIGTHSPYFIDWEAITNGAALIRTSKNSEGDIELFGLSDVSRESIKKFRKDLNQPHTLGLEAKETLFLEDKIILVEGQEDVVMFNLISDQLGIEPVGDYFGWGVGGAEKTKYILVILQDLGYKQVCVVLDGDKESEKERLQKEFSSYNFFCIPADDIRDKPARGAQGEKEGIVNSKGNLKCKYRKKMRTLLEEINGVFSEC